MVRIALSGATHNFLSGRLQQTYPTHTPRRIRRIPTLPWLGEGKTGEEIARLLTEFPR